MNGSSKPQTCAVSSGFWLGRALGERPYAERPLGQRPLGNESVEAIEGYPAPSALPRRPTARVELDGMETHQPSSRDALISFILIVAGLGVFAAMCFVEQRGSEYRVVVEALSEWFLSALLIGAGIGAPFHRWKLGAVLGPLLAFALAYWWNS